MRIRRRRRDYTTDQEASRKALHRAEMWSAIVGNGIAKALESERYCSDGSRMIIDFVITEFADATNALDAANKHHDKVMGYGSRRRLRSAVATVAPSGRKLKGKKKAAA